MQTLDLTWGRLLKIWWAAFWKGRAGLLVAVIPLVILEIDNREFYQHWYTSKPRTACIGMPFYGNLAPLLSLRVHPCPLSA
jgi:hypothetical protein